jgi:hypothetical protein
MDSNSNFLVDMPGRFFADALPYRRAQFINQEKNWAVPRKNRARAASEIDDTLTAAIPGLKPRSSRVTLTHF